MLPPEVRAWIGLPPPLMVPVSLCSPISVVVTGISVRTVPPLVAAFSSPVVSFGTRTVRSPPELDTEMPRFAPTSSAVTSPPEVWAAILPSIVARMSPPEVFSSESPRMPRAMTLPLEVRASTVADDVVEVDVAARSLRVEIAVEARHLDVAAGRVERAFCPRPARPARRRRRSACPPGRAARVRRISPPESCRERRPGAARR